MQNEILVDILHHGNVPKLPIHYVNRKSIVSSLLLLINSNKLILDFVTSQIRYFLTVLFMFCHLNLSGKRIARSPYGIRTV